MIKFGCSSSRVWWPKFVLPAPGAGVKCPPVPGKGTAAAAGHCAVPRTGAMCRTSLLGLAAELGLEGRTHGLGRENTKNTMPIY